MNPSESPLSSSMPESRSPFDGSQGAIPLPPQPLPHSPQDSVAGDLARVDLLLASFLVLLAFLLASTAARNSDLWLHLATGRAIADGSYRFHGDPFGQDTSAWIAHSWLCDLIGYELFHRFGGSVLVILKALLTAFLAGLLVVQGRREGGGLLWPTLAALLSILVIGNRLLLQPALVSLVLLAVTMSLIERGRRLRATQKAGWLNAYGPICLLFALWANLDDWFLLGPLTVGLFLLGDVLAAVGGGERKHTDMAGLGLALAGGLLACLLTPFHIHGFTLPPALGLTAAAKVLKQDPVLQSLFLSPFEAAYFHSGAAWSLSGLAYLALVLLSGLSFLTSRLAWRSWRLPLWLGFFGLSAWSVRGMPFFAVAAAPILALNVQDLTENYRPAWLRRQGFFLGRLVRAAALLLMLGLLVAAWPGWLQGAPYEMRRWLVLADPSLRQAAQRINDWRADGKLAGGDRGFNFAPEVANYFAWFCPEEKGRIDVRLQVSPAVAADYVTVRQSLLDDAPSKIDWRRILRAGNIDHVVLYDNNPERMQAVYRRLAQRPDEWFLMAVEGRTAIFGWRDPRKTAAAALEKLRFPLLEKTYLPSEKDKAPLNWPGRGPETPSWWNAFVKTRPAGTLDRDEAALLLTQFDTLRAPTLLFHSQMWDASRIASVLGFGPATLATRLQQILDLYCFQILHTELPRDSQGRPTALAQLALALRANYLQAQDDAPPEFLWLVIRAARRALGHDPDDVQAYLILGEAYLRLVQATRERTPAQHLPLLEHVHELQASTAFHQALLLDPDLIAAHAGLTLIYRGGGQWDLWQKHLHEVLRLTEAKGRLPNENLKQWQRRLDLLMDEVRQVDEKVSLIRNDFEVAAAKMKIKDRAVQAQAHGLGGKALEILLQADVASLGPNAVRMELELLFVTGRVPEVRAWMLPEHKNILGSENYNFFRILLAATCGDYEQADAELAALSTHYDPPLHLNNTQLSLRQSIALGVGRFILEGRLQRDSLPQFLDAIGNDALVLRKQAEASVLRGLFALERGDTRRAQDFLGAGLKVYQSEAAVRTGRGLDFFGRPLAEHYWKMLAAVERQDVISRVRRGKAESR
jgi:hypothetical protein